MFKTKMIGLAAAVCVSSFFSCAASAQMYAGAEVGSANANTNCEGVTECKSSSVSGNVFAGYSVLPNWGIEAAYVHLGKVSGTVTGTSNQQAVTANYEAKNSAIDLAVLYKTDFDRNWAAFAKLGVSRIRAEDTVSGTVGTTVVSTNYTNNSTAPVYGVGFNYKITPKVLFVMAVDRRKVKAYDSNGIDLNFNVTNVSLGAQYSF